MYVSYSKHDGSQKDCLFLAVTLHVAHAVHAGRSTRWARNNRVRVVSLRGSMLAKAADLLAILTQYTRMRH